MTDALAHVKALTFDKPAIDSFGGAYRWLSNFFMTECAYDGVLYPSSEHAYQAAKFAKDSPHREAIRGLGTPQETKTHARAFKHLWEKDFHDRKDQIMLDCVRSKFILSKVLEKKLLDTYGSELIEGNTWGDRYWGKVQGEGENMLGLTLMRVREGLFLWSMAAIYPGDPSGELSKEACGMLGLPFFEVKLKVSYGCTDCDNTGRARDGSRCQECGGSGWVEQ